MGGSQWLASLLWPTLLLIHLSSSSSPISPLIKVPSPPHQHKSSTTKKPSSSLTRASARGLGGHTPSLVATAVLLLTSTCVALSLLQPCFWTDMQTGVRGGTITYHLPTSPYCECGGLINACMVRWALCGWQMKQARKMFKKK